MAKNKLLIIQPSHYASKANRTVFKSKITRAGTAGTSVSGGADSA